MFDADKTRMIVLPYGKKNYDDMLSRFHLIPERNGRTDGQTDRRTDLLYQYRVSVCWRAIIDQKWTKTKNLAVANRSRISSAHEVTTLNFQGWGVFEGGGAFVTSVVTAAAGSINFRVGFTGKHLWQPWWQKIPQFMYPIRTQRPYKGTRGNFARVF